MARLEIRGVLLFYSDTTELGEFKAKVEKILHRLHSVRRLPSGKELIMVFQREESTFFLGKQEPLAKIGGNNNEDE